MCAYRRTNTTDSLQKNTTVLKTTDLKILQTACGKKTNIYPNYRN